MTPVASPADWIECNFVSLQAEEKIDAVSDPRWFTAAWRPQSYPWMHLSQTGKQPENAFGSMCGCSCVVLKSTFLDQFIDSLKLLQNRQSYHICEHFRVFRIYTDSTLISFRKLNHHISLSVRGKWVHAVGTMNVFHCNPLNSCS